MHSGTAIRQLTKTLTATTHFALTRTASFPSLSTLSHAAHWIFCSKTNAQGYAVIDNVFGSATVQRLKQELLSVYSQGLMHLNHTHLVSKGATKLLPKSQIQVCHTDTGMRGAVDAPYTPAQQAMATDNTNFE